MCNSNNLYNIFLGFLIKSGKKKSAKKILDQTVAIVSKEVNLISGLIFFEVFSKLNTFIEVKKMKSKRGSHVIPLLISHKRRSYLVVK